MRSNGLLKWLMIPVALLVLFVAIRLFSGGGSSAPPAADASSTGAHGSALTGSKARNSWDPVCASAASSPA